MNSYMPQLRSAAMTRLIRGDIADPHDNQAGEADQQQPPNDNGDDHWNNAVVGIFCDVVLFSFLFYMIMRP